MADAAPPPVTDLADVFPELHRLRGRALGGELDGALADLAVLGEQHGPDQVVAWEVLARTPGLDAALEQRLAEHPLDVAGRTLLAHRLILGAEEAGAGARSSEVPADRFTDVHDRLRSAEQVLLRLCAEDPGDPQPWHLRLWTAAQLGLPRGEARRRYVRLYDADPHHHAGQRRMLQALSPAAGGSWDDALGFAREVAATVPAGDVEGTILAAAHLGRWRTESSGRDRGHLRDKDVLEELEDAADRFRGLPCPSRFAWVLPHTEFAVLFGIAGRTDRALAHFRVLGTALAPGPWEAAGHHRTALSALRARAIAEREGR